MQNRREPPREPATDAGAPDSNASNATPVSLDQEELISFLIEITRDVWRLESCLTRTMERQAVSPELEASIERLKQDIHSFGLEAYDPVGQAYDPAMRVEVAQLEPDGIGDLLVKRTVLAGVSLRGMRIQAASVIVGRKQEP
jgi:hypothetical protein